MSPRLRVQSPPGLSFPDGSSLFSVLGQPTEMYEIIMTPARSWESHYNCKIFKVYINNKSTKKNLAGKILSHFIFRLIIKLFEEINDTIFRNKTMNFIMYFLCYTAKVHQAIMSL